MKVAVASDTQGVLPEINGRYDLFVHCGNFCPVVQGDHASIQAQVAWLHAQFRPWLETIHASHKIIIPGHNDIAVSYLEPNFEYHIDAIYLRDQAATVDGLVVYGMPWVPHTLRRHTPSKSTFIARSPRMYEAALERIPDNVNILVTRIPPQGILDRLGSARIGDNALLARVSALPMLRMHFFGFATENGGQFVYRNNQLFANGCLGQVGYVEVDIDLTT